MSAPLRLWTMNGLGNRFAIFDARQRPFRPTEDQVRALADPARGGMVFDQMFVLEPSGHGEAFMRIWNRDGEEVGACGNGARCVGWLLMEESGRSEATFETASGLLSAARAGPLAVSVDMGRPGLDWTQIPLAERMDTVRIELQVGPIDNPVLWGPGCVSMGNPHCVFFVDNAETAPVTQVGAMIEFHPLFPQRTNVGFAQVKAPDRIRLRVWERGAGLTQACGTGACAALVAAARRGLTGREATLELDGGELHVAWRASDGHVIMTGPVELEATGTIAV
jgi:diaminopimelate epimerase